MDWQLQLFECAASWTGKEKDMVVRRLAGWVCEPFAIDPRRYEDEDGDLDRGWVISHLPTGYAALGIKGSLDTAKEIAEKLRALECWDFVDPASAAAVKAAVLKIRDQHSGVCSPARFESPLWLDT